MAEKKKGGKRPGAGRPPGAVNTLTGEFRGLISDTLRPIIKNDLERWLKEANPDKRIEFLIQLLEYLCPKPAPELPEQPEQMNDGSQGQQFTIEVKPIDYRTAAAALASRSDADNASPGESESALDGEALG